MKFRIFNKLASAREWVKAVRLYRSEHYNEFLCAVEKFEESNTLSPYQLALKANALLMSDRYKEALSLFSLISSGGEALSSDHLYIQLYAQAMISDINGDTAGFKRISSKAYSIKCSYLIKNNLPLPKS